MTTAQRRAHKVAAKQLERVTEEFLQVTTALEELLERDKAEPPMQVEEEHIFHTP